MNIEAYIKKARTEKGMTRKELADSVGVTVNAISNYENGVSMPRIQLLAKILSVLDVDANEMLGVSRSIGSLSKRAIHMARKFDELDSAGQDFIEMVITHENTRLNAGNLFFLHHVQEQTLLSCCLPSDKAIAPKHAG